MQDELISKQAVLEQINCWIGSGEYRYAMSERFLIDRIKTLKPVKQEPKITTYYINEKGQRTQIDYDIYDTARISREQLEILLEVKGFRKCGEE